MSCCKFTCTGKIYRFGWNTFDFNLYQSLPIITFFVLTVTLSEKWVPISAKLVLKKGGHTEQILYSAIGNLTLPIFDLNNSKI